MFIVLDSQLVCEAFQQEDQPLPSDLALMQVHFQRIKFQFTCFQVCPLVH